MNIFDVCLMMRYLRSIVRRVIAESQGHAYSILNFSRCCQIYLYDLTHHRSGSDSIAVVPSILE